MTFISLNVAWIIQKRPESNSMSSNTRHGSTASWDWQYPTCEPAPQNNEHSTPSTVKWFQHWSEKRSIKCSLIEGKLQRSVSETQSTRPDLAFTCELYWKLISRNLKQCLTKKKKLFWEKLKGRIAFGTRWPFADRHKWIQHNLTFVETAYCQQE